MSKLALIVDDSRVARIALKKVLMPHEVLIEEAGSAEEALSELNSESTLPDIIYMDVMMPGMDGLTAIRLIKTDPKLKHIPIVVCTSNETELDNENALDAGAITVLTKPPQLEKVNDIMTALSQQAEALPKQKSVVVKVDKASITEKVVEIIEQKLQPRLKEQIEQHTIDAVQTACQNYLTQELPSQIDPIKQQVSSEIMVQLDDAAKTQVLPIVEAEMHSLLKQNVEGEVQKALDAALADMAIDKQVEKKLADYEPPKDIEPSHRESIVDDLSRQVAKLHKIVVGLSLTMLVLAVLYFI